jgi:hypothetical protein
MDGTVVAVIVIVLVVVVLALIVGIQQNKRRRLRERFGPEYERRVETSGDRREAEREMHDLARERDGLDIKPLDPDARERYVAVWGQVQAQFVDEPQTALESANTLVGQVMRDRGYPVDDFERRADLITVDHPGVVDHYRAAHDVQVRSSEGGVTTEEQRVAFVHYRELFAELVEVGAADRADSDAELDSDRRRVPGSDS